MRHIPWRRLAICLVIGALLNVVVAMACGLWSPLRWSAIERHGTAWDGQFNAITPEEWKSTGSSPGSSIEFDVASDAHSSLMIGRRTKSQPLYRRIESGFGITKLHATDQPTSRVNEDSDSSRPRIPDDQRMAYLSGWPFRSSIAVGIPPDEDAQRDVDGYHWNFGRDVPETDESDNLNTDWRGGILAHEHLQPRTDRNILNYVAIHRPLIYHPLPLGFALNTLVYGGTIMLLWWIVPTLIRAHRSSRGRCPRCAYDVTGLCTCPECGTAVS